MIIKKNWLWVQLFWQLFKGPNWPQTKWYTKKLNFLCCNMLFMWYNPFSGVSSRNHRTGPNFWTANQKLLFQWLSNSQQKGCHHVEGFIKYARNWSICLCTILFEIIFAFGKMWGLKKTFCWPFLVLSGCGNKAKRPLWLGITAKMSGNGWISTFHLVWLHFVACVQSQFVGNHRYQTLRLTRVQWLGYHLRFVLK